MSVLRSAVIYLMLVSWVVAQDAARRTFVDPAKAGADFLLQGEYEGKAGPDSLAGAQIVALGDGKFAGVLYARGLPGGTWDGKTKLAISGETRDGSVRLTGTNFEAKISSGRLTGTLDTVELNLQRVERQSPTLGANPPQGAIVLFDGSNTDEWVGGRLQEGNLLGVGTRTKRAFRNYTLHLEFRTPYMPFDRGQGRGNSGMYLNDQYEFQILDSFGLSGENNECGGYYSFAKPALNMCLPPLSWQTYDADFTMARFDAQGNKTAPAVVTVKLNGVAVHSNYAIPKFNGGGGLTDESKPGAIFVQDHGNPVHFRNIWILEKP
jgi:Domain of Unknown Function (DUF1080)